MKPRWFLIVLVGVHFVCYSGNSFSNLKKLWMDDYQQKKIDQILYCLLKTNIDSQYVKVVSVPTEDNINELFQIFLDRKRFSINMIDKIVINGIVRRASIKPLRGDFFINIFEMIEKKFLIELFNDDLNHLHAIYNENLDDIFFLFHANEFLMKNDVESFESRNILYSLKQQKIYRVNTSVSSPFHELTQDLREGSIYNIFVKNGFNGNTIDQGSLGKALFDLRFDRRRGTPRNRISKSMEFYIDNSEIKGVSENRMF